MSRRANVSRTRVWPVVGLGIAATVAVATGAGADSSARQNGPATQVGTRDPLATKRPRAPRLPPDEDEMTLSRNGKTYVVRYKVSRKLVPNENGGTTEVITTNVDDVLAALPPDVAAEIRAANAARAGTKPPG